MYQRLSKILKSNSFFLFGPRGSGKTSLLMAEFKDKRTLWINLLNEDEYRKFAVHPEQIDELVSEKYDWVVIDEVQRVPTLLNHVHKIIENSKIKFALTGSSARKLKREGANLLAGRAFENKLHPLTSFELGNDLNLAEILNYGSLPKIFSLETTEEKNQYLRSYANIYIKSEIKEEQVVRKIEPFLKFLEVAAQMNGKILNYSKIATDAGVDSKAVERYFEILVDTFIGFFLEPFHESVRKRQSQKSKFYFFDLGVKKALERTLTVPIISSTYTYGDAFESFFILECIRLNDYYLKDYKFSYLRTKDDLEIDLIVDRPGLARVYIEIKSTKNFNSDDVYKYSLIKKDLKAENFWFVTQDKNRRKVDSFLIIPWQDALKELFAINNK